MHDFPNDFTRQLPENVHNNPPAPLPRVLFVCRFLCVVGLQISLRVSPGTYLPSIWHNLFMITIPKLSKHSSGQSSKNAPQDLANLSERIKIPTQESPRSVSISPKQFAKLFSDFPKAIARECPQDLANLSPNSANLPNDSSMTLPAPPPPQIALLH